MDSGLAISVVIIFFCLEYPKNDTIGLHSIQSWWGNTVFVNTDDFRGTSFLDMPTDGFGYVLCTPPLSIC